MLPAKPVTDIADSIQALFVGDILPVLDKISSAEYQVIMYMPFVNVSYGCSTRYCAGVHLPRPYNPSLSATGVPGRERNTADPSGI